MGMAAELNNWMEKEIYIAGYVIEYKTPSGKGLKHIETYKTYEAAKKDFDLIIENKNKVFKRYKGKFSLLKVKYHRFFHEDYFLDQILE